MACRLGSRWPTQSTVARRHSGCTPALRPTTAREPPVGRATPVQRWSCRLLEIETEIEIEVESIPAPLRAGRHAAGGRHTFASRPAPAPPRPLPQFNQTTNFCNFPNRALRRHVWQVVAAGVSERLRLNRYRRKVVHIISPAIASKLGKRCHPTADTLEIPLPRMPHGARVRVQNERCRRECEFGANGDPAATRELVC